MGNFIIRRLLYMILVLVVVSAITFGLMHAIPGGPFDREKALPEEIMKNLEARYHLDDPLHIQYARYLYDIFIPKFSLEAPKMDILNDSLIQIKLGPVYVSWMNFGPSYISNSRTVNDIFRQQLPVSMQLGTLALLIALVIGIPSGIIAALKQNSILDYLSMSVAIIGVSVPVIILGPIMIWLLAVEFNLLPPTGWGMKPPYVLGLFPNDYSWQGFWQYTIMPAFALGLGSSAVIARLTRASLLQVIREDYIRTARAKGLKEKMIILRHALKNALIPVVTILGPMFAALLTGTFVTETIFGIPGMGRYFVTSITNRDYPVILGTILLYALFLVIANLVVDVLYAVLDPRIKYN